MLSALCTEQVKRCQGEHQAYLRALAWAERHGFAVKPSIIAVRVAVEGDGQDINDRCCGL